MKRLLFLSVLLPSVASAQLYPATQCVSATPTLDTAAYASGDLMGGKLTFNGALRNTSNAGFVASISLTDKAAQDVDLELVLFDENPTGTTFTDQAAFDPADADLDKIAAVELFGSSKRFAYSDNGFKFAGSLAHPVGATASATTVLYGALVARGAYDGDADSITVTVCVSQD